MIGCCVMGCRSSTWENKPKLYRIPFEDQSPSESHRRQLWLEALKCQHLDADRIKGSRVCGAHFISGKMSMDSQNPDFVPSIFKAKRIKKPVFNPDFVSTDRRYRKDGMNKLSEKKTAEKPIPHKKMKKNDSVSPEVPTPRRTTFAAGEDIELEWPERVDLKMQYRLLQGIYTDLQAEVDTLSATNERLKEDLHRVRPRLSYASVKTDNKQVQFLTGLPVLVFDWLVTQAVASEIDRVVPELTTQDHILIALMKLKLGLCDMDLAYRFGISESSITRLCQTLLPALAALLKPLIAWQSAKITSKCKPKVLKGKFKKCRYIIDCPKFVLVGGPEVKQESTVKYFTSVTPAGTVCFLSQGYSSSITEEQIVEESGFLHMVAPQTDILANGQMPIEDKLASLGSVLHVMEPNGGKQTQKKDLETQFRDVWTHVKKVSEWWKEFRMLQKVIQEPYAYLLDEILIVGAGLTNVNLSLGLKGSHQS